MEHLLNATLSKLPIAIIFAAACAVSTGAIAQNDSKRALAVKLAQMQQKADGEAISYLGICLCGPQKKVNSLTGSIGLLR